MPLFCVINGWAIGIGGLIPLGCDPIYEVEDARFKLPQVSLGILPGNGGLVRLANSIGRGKASEMALTGEPLTTQEVLQLGLVQWVFPDIDTLRDHTEAQARLTGDMSKMSTYLALDHQNRARVLNDPGRTKGLLSDLRLTC